MRPGLEWEASPQRAAWIAQVSPLLDGEGRLEQQPGLEFWFTPPGSPSLARPRRWKMMAVTLLALYPTSLIVGVLVWSAPRWSTCCWRCVRFPRCCWWSRP